MPVKTGNPQKVTIGTYNTITLSNDDVFTLVTPFCGPYYYDVFNLGPCTVYIRADADPAVGDPKSETLPPFCADNLILVPEGTTGLRFIAGPPCAGACGAGFGPPPCATGNQGCIATITVRLVQAA